MTKQSLNLESMGQKYGVGYKVQPDASSNKVKKEYSNSEYQNLFSPDVVGKRPQNYQSEFTSFDDTYSTTSASGLPYPYTGKLATVAPNVFTSGGKAFIAPPTASSKVFVHDHDHHHGKHHFVHDVVGHYITDVAGHKLKHAGEVLESGLLTEPIIHKLSFAKAALLQLLAIIGPLSAIKTIHVVAKASEPHHRSEPEHEVPPVGPTGPVEHGGEGFGHHSYPPTLVGIMMHFMASLSKFNTDAKLHLIPNLLKIISSASAASSRVSKHPH